MDTNLTALVDYHSGCERIVRTPIPFAYAQHIKLFVTLFCFTVPFAIVDAMKGYTPVAAAIFAFALFGIDEIGVEIEDPFGYDDNDLPIERIAATIKTSTRRHRRLVDLRLSSERAQPPSWKTFWKVMRSSTSFDLMAPDRNSRGPGREGLAHDAREDLRARLEHAVGGAALGLAGLHLALLLRDAHRPLRVRVVAEREVERDRLRRRRRCRTSSRGRRTA